MVAPVEIIDALESILDIFLSDIRHRERSAYILCDNFVEMACKTKAKQHNHNVNLLCGFHRALRLPGCRLNAELRTRLQIRRDTRNLMQHASAAAAVDFQTCADAIMELPVLIQRLWGRNALNNMRSWHNVALRVINIYSSNGDAQRRQEFEDAMRNDRWRTLADERKPKVNEAIIEIGLRKHWCLIVKQAPNQVEQILNLMNLP